MSGPPLPQPLGGPTPAMVQASAPAWTSPREPAASLSARKVSRCSPHRSASLPSITRHVTTLAPVGTEAHRSRARPAYPSTMNIRCRLRRCATALALASLPLLGVGLAPSSLADDLGPCGWDAGSMACLQAQTAAGANCSQGGITPTTDCMWSPNGGFNYSPPAPAAPPLTPAPGAPPAPAPEVPPAP